MTQEEINHQHVDMINYLIDLNNEIGEVWKYHPENPNRIDPELYHAILVAKIEKMEKELKEFEFHANIDNV
jgi:hypothetical protein